MNNFLSSPLYYLKVKKTLLPLKNIAANKIRKFRIRNRYFLIKMRRIRNTD